MNFTKTKFEGLIVIDPDVFKDERGYFIKRYNKNDFQTAGINQEFVEDNHSLSQKGVLRGLHFQKKPFSLGKLVFVTTGSILDITVDLRKHSPTYKEWFSIELTEDNKKMLFIPEGFAHGFLALSKNTLVQYKYTNFYDKKSEYGLIWNDPELNIDWQLDKYGIKNMIISEKDQNNLLLKEIEKRHLFD